MGGLQEHLIKILFEIFSVLFRQWVVPSLHQIIVEGSVGTPGRTNCHRWEFQVFDWPGWGGSWDWRLLPIQVRFTDKVSSSWKPKANHHHPKTFANFGLKEEEFFVLFKRFCIVSQTPIYFIPLMQKCKKVHGWLKNPETLPEYPFCLLPSSWDGLHVRKALCVFWSIWPDQRFLALEELPLFWLRNGEPSYLCHKLSLHRVPVGPVFKVNAQQSSNMSTSPHETLSNEPGIGSI